MTRSPFALFEAWFADARASEPIVPEAMSLATVGADGQPTSRMVLLKAHGEDGFVFYTNLESRKALQIAEQPRAALLFHWKSRNRQVRIEGTLARVNDAEADAYFATRPRESQLGAWASDQSRPLVSREQFEQRFDAMHVRFDGVEVPRPPYWSGYRLTPQRLEFWEDRAHRLHDRHLFMRSGTNWTESLLFP